MDDVIVLGAGVVGLTCAVRLLEAGARVRVVSADEPGHSVSRLAAAVWYPTRTEADARVLAWAHRTYDALMAQAGEGVPGVARRPTRMVVRRGVAETPWWAAAVPDFSAHPQRRRPDHDRRPEDVSRRTVDPDTGTRDPRAHSRPGQDNGPRHPRTHPRPGQDDGAGHPRAHPRPGQDNGPRHPRTHPRPGQDDESWDPRMRPRSGQDDGPWEPRMHRDFGQDNGTGDPGAGRSPDQDREPEERPQSRGVDRDRGEWRFTVPSVEMEMYLPWLAERVRALGGTLERGRLERLADLGGQAGTVVNATGLASRVLAGDAGVFPARGQIVVVANPGLETSVRDEEHPGGMTYIHPRSRDVVLGGTFQPGDWSEVPDPATTAAILRRCAELVPELAGARPLWDAAGLRPAREGGPRLEVDPEPLPRGTRLIHCYGHGGAGVTLSWGCADDVARLAGGWEVRRPGF